MIPNCTWNDPVKWCWMCRQDEKALADFPDPDAVGEFIDAAAALPLSSLSHAVEVERFKAALAKLEKP